LAALAVAGEVLAAGAEVVESAASAGQVSAAEGEAVGPAASAEQVSVAEGEAVESAALAGQVLAAAGEAAEVLVAGEAGMEDELHRLCFRRRLLLLRGYRHLSEE